MLRQINVKLLAVAVALLLLAATFLTIRDSEETKTVSAHFPRAVSIFENTDVRVLGVTVGKVTAVVPEGNSVRVDMEYDAEVKLPDDAKAVIITPTLVADRFVQLTPAYTSGAVLADAADIKLADTGVPVELDRIYSGLRDLTTALGPNGANSDGTLNHLLKVADQNLKGKGAKGNKMINDLARAAVTFGNGSGDLFDTVEHLANFTQTLARNDKYVVAFMKDLAGVSADLADEREELEQALSSVAKAVGSVKTFIKTNRQAISTDVEKLTRVAKNIASEKDALDLALTAGPVGISNLILAFDEKSGSIGSRFGFQGNVADSDGFLCAVVQQSELPKVSKDLACKLFKQILEPVVSKASQGQPAASRTPADDRSGPQSVGQYAPDSGTTLADLTGAR
ncbi:MCE family protein [Nocardioides sp. JQ2195]|uniref:MCE family protein n=1 Tax=Nocardioides sp. JQ2195 TaxID=2592334 RepID=UPI00143ED39F|nr:MCE family protein [Nocardioides sp. JQ2195]QIX26622.1 MCE family protein [Nocardioides sp. JQ2195]